MSKEFEIFLGYADDAENQIKIIKDLEPEIDSYIKNEANGFSKSKTFTNCKYFEWRENAPLFTGGQGKKINPYIENADLAIFIFKSRIGETTKKEVDLARSLNKNIICLFPNNNIYADLMTEGFTKFKQLQDLKDFKSTLTNDWNIPESESVTPLPEYDNNTLKKIVLDNLKKVIKHSYQQPLELDLKKHQDSNIITKSKIYIKKIAVLSLSPLNEKSLYSLDDIFDRFENYNIELKYLTLNEENLDNLDNFETIFIFSKIINNNLMIESEYFESKLIDISLVNETLLDYENTNFHIFTSSDTDVDTENLCFDIINTQNNTKENLRKYLSKNYRKKFQRGIFLLDKNTTNIPYDFKIKNSLKYFVGRENDIRNIIRDIIELKKSKEIYTIFGSGGIGKTTLVSKIIEELSNRAKFTDGFSFVDCESIQDYTDFREQIKLAFEMNSVQNFEEQLGLNKSINKLIILDNFETLLYLENNQDLKNIKVLIEYIQTYSTIIITSREKIDDKYKEPYILESLKLSDTLKLFLSISNITLKDEKEEIFLKDQILDNLLYKNSLAVKLAAGLRLNIYDLEKELRENLFKTTDIEDSEFIEAIFSKKANKNIEKSTSLFYTIGLSYERLELKHKLVIELLSLFPDGLNKKKFIEFYNEDEQQNDKTKITYKDINILEDKSMIIVNNEFIKLQSIIGKFAEYKFNKNTKLEKLNYYKKAFNYNNYILTEIKAKRKNNDLKYIKLYIKNRNNFLKSLDYLNLLSYEIQILKYIEGLIDFFIINPTYDNKVIASLKNLKRNFDHFSFKDKFFDSLILSVEYFYGSFDKSFNEMKKEYPFSKIIDSSSNDDINIEGNFLQIYAMEGMQYQIMQYIIKKYVSFSYWYLVQIGEFKFTSKIYKLKDFHPFTTMLFYYELELNTNTLNLRELESTIHKLNNIQLLEKIQLTYVLFKYDNSMIKLQDINELIVTNPFTDGLKTLMLAIKSNEACPKSRYEEAINKLFHIKYYFVEAIYLYCKYLKVTEDIDYDKWFKEGKEFSEKYYYRYLQHQFICLDSELYTDYDEENYPLPEKLDYFETIKEYKLKGL